MVASSLPVYADRSRIQTRQLCSRKRYYGYDFNGTGLQKRGSKYDAAFGTILHSGVALMLRGSRFPHSDELAMLYGNIEQAITDAYPNLSPEHKAHFVKEQSWLLALLMWGWFVYRYPTLQAEYNIELVEVENKVIFHPDDYLPSGLAGMMRPLEFPLRMDALLKQKQTGVYFIWDAKTTSAASTDWNVNLDNSLQSCMYVEAAELLLGEYVGGIFYSGFVKGRREQDNAASSPYRGQTIQYGSFLYGWQAKDKTIYKDYVKGRQRVFLPTGQPTSWTDIEKVLDNIASLGFDTLSYFPTTIPWKPINSKQVVGAEIVAENNYHGTLELLRDSDLNAPAGQLAAAVLMEPTLDACHKYGSKHQCEFVSLCNGNPHPDDVVLEFEPRVPHHEEPGTEGAK